MKTVNIKNSSFCMMIVVLLCSLGFAVQAQESNWAKQRSQQLKNQLGLTEEQSNQIYEALATGERKKKEIRENTGGDKPKMTVWQIDKEQNDKIASILTAEQNEKLKQLREQANNKGQAKAQETQQATASSGAVPYHKWSDEYSKRLKKELDLTDEQTQQLYTLLATLSLKRKEVKETQEGDEQKKALWRIDKEQRDGIAAILTPVQREKLKEFQAKQRNK